jgi:uncharacterized protein (AIM24 family)
MSGSPSRTDQGLFLAHFTKGKELFDQRKYPESEKELEEAYLLKPRDPQVLNLLGIVYFKTEKLARAEEVYRKLLAESPEAHTLYYNLGLIYLKLGRLEEAEPAFLKALQLASDNPKIHFYLGSIYERLQRFQDAIYQYRQAGAQVMVRRVEDRMTHAPGTLTPPVQRKKKDDTAEFKAKEVQEVLERAAWAPAPKAKALEPVSPKLMAEGAPSAGAPAAPAGPVTTPAIDVEKTKPKMKVKQSDTSPFGLSNEGAAGPHTIPPERRHEITAPVATPRFRMIGRSLIEANFSGKLFIKQGTIYSYSGALTFWVKQPRGEAPAPLVIVTGAGRMILTDRDREITLLDLDDERIHVDPRHVLALDEGLVPRVVRVGKEDADEPMEFLEIEGRGTVALSHASRPLPLAITPDLPACVPAASVIYWKGSLTPQEVRDTEVSAVMATTGGSVALLRLEGTGQLMVEQWLGDRDHDGARG